MKEFKQHAPRSAYNEQESDETPRILSSEEKRELILAHTRSQTAKDPLQRMTVWGGVLIAVSGIAVGWWWTVGANIKMSAQRGLPEFQEITKNLDDFTETVQKETDSLQKPIVPTNSANAGEFSGLMKAVLEGDARKDAPRNDLLAPSAKNSGTSASTSSTDTDTDTDLPTQLIDPETPGLTPEQQ